MREGERIEGAGQASRTREEGLGAKVVGRGGTVGAVVERGEKERGGGEEE